MSLQGRCLWSVAASITLVLFLLEVLLLSAPTWGQASYTAQIRGTVADQSGAVIRNATITITNVGTNISTTAKTDTKGLYLLPALRPDAYVLRAEAPGFRGQEKTNIVLQVDQQTTVDFTLAPAGVNMTVEVSQAAPLLDTASANVGTDVTNVYVRDIPLYNRSIFGLDVLPDDVSETDGAALPVYCP